MTEDTQPEKFTDIIPIVKRIKETNLSQNPSGTNSDDLNELFTAAVDYSRRVISKMCSNRPLHIKQELCEIIPQEVAVTLIEEFHAIKHEKAFPSWIRTVTLNKINRYFEFHTAAKRDFNKAFSLDTEEEILIPSSEPAGEDYAVANENRENLIRWLQENLSSTQYKVVLKRLDGDNFTEIAADLDITHGAARMQYDRAIKKLREIPNAESFLMDVPKPQVTIPLVAGLSPQIKENGQGH